MSLVGLTMTILVHGCVHKLRSLMSSKMLLHLCSALFFGLVLFILASFAPGGADSSSSSSSLAPTQCILWAVGLHYFWLVAFLWMVMEGLQLYAVVVIIMGLNLERRMRYYTITAWSKCGWVPMTRKRVKVNRVVTPTSFVSLAAQLVWRVTVCLVSHQACL